MDHEEEFLSTFFTQVAQLCTDKAKELVVCRQNSMKLITCQVSLWILGKREGFI